MTSSVHRAFHSLQEEDRLFGRMLGLSLSLHGAFLVVLMAWKWMLPQEPLIKIEDTIQIDLVNMAAAPSSGAKKSARLPDKETFVPPPAQDPKPVAAMVEPKTEQKAEPAPKPEPPREATSIAEALKKDPTPQPDPAPGVDEAAREAMNRALARVRTSERLAKLTGAEGTRNRSAGSGGEGGSGESGANCTADPGWCSGLSRRFAEVWLILPTWANKSMKVIVNVKLDAEGGVRDVQVVQGSGDTGFDNAAVRAVKKAAPIPLPTQADFRTAVLTDGLYLGFTPKGLSQ